MQAPSNAQPIGVFDSGVGVLTVLRELIARLPGESFVYFGDTARVPYGGKSAETVRRFSRENIEFLLARNVKMVVIACNTASSHALPAMASEFGVPIVGVIEPGVRAAAAATRNGRIAVIGTVATVRSDAYPSRIREAKPGAMVVSQPCPLFVPLVEEGWVDAPITRLVAEEYLRVFHGSGVDTLVLGCTHYPLLKRVIGEVVGQEVVLVDSAVETAREVETVLRTNGIAGSGGGDFHIVLSDTSAAFAGLAMQCLGKTVPDIELVSVG
jgi:glutamate racemase